MSASSLFIWTLRFSSEFLCHNHPVPRVPSLGFGVTFTKEMLPFPRTALPVPHCYYELMRQSKILSEASLLLIPLSLGRLLLVPAGSWTFPTLSLQSLYGCLDPYPVATSWCLYPFLPKRLRPHDTGQSFGSQITPCMQLHQGKIFEAAVILLCSDPHIRSTPWLLPP